ncbi:MAG: chemotaxis protein CheW [Nitrospirae bacterium]|nr:chemotaxis protein CheW [Nitrospirota bacterium]
MERPKSEEQVIIFLLRGDKFGVSIRNLVEVSKLEGLKREGDKGIYEGKLMLREHEVPVVNLSMLFHLGEGDNSENVRIIVLGKSSKKMIGLKVDAVSEVITYPLRSVRPVPKMIMDNTINYFLGIGRVKEEDVLFLNDDEIITATGSGKT